MKKVKFFLKWLVLTWYGRIALSVILMLIGFVPLNWIDEYSVAGTILYYTGMVGVAGLAVITLIMIAYAWVINPIREWKETKKMREEAKNKK